MSDEKSSGGFGTIIVLLLAVIVLGIMWGGWNRGDKSFESIRDMGRNVLVASITPTVCEKTSENGVYSFTDSDGTIFGFAPRVKRGDKWLTAEEAYDVFKKNRAYQVRVGRVSDLIGSPRVYAIESASSRLKAKRC